MPGTERQPSSLRCFSALVQTSSGLMSTSGWLRSSETSMTTRRSCTSTWVAARPMPWASYMVASMSETSVRRTALGALPIIAGALLVAPAQAQTPPISSGQRATAQQVSERGIPLSELAPNAPDTYTVQRGDTLWGISGLYLKRPWRWPELWGMNLKAIATPPLIYPGQPLSLDKDGSYARLRTTPPGVSDSEPQTVRVSPRTRSDSLASTALPTLKSHLTEPFLVEPLVVDADALQRAPRIVATTADRVLMASGDRGLEGGDGTPP